MDSNLCRLSAETKTQSNGEEPTAAVQTHNSPFAVSCAAQDLKSVFPVANPATIGKSTIRIQICQNVAHKAPETTPAPKSRETQEVTKITVKSTPYPSTTTTTEACFKTNPSANPISIKLMLAPIESSSLCEDSEASLEEPL
jgi:hypothetical protein